MSINPELNITGKSYQNKAQVAGVCRSIINGIKDHELLRGAEGRFVAALFRRHPEFLEKSGCGIAGFTVGTDSRWQKTRHFIVVRIDQTTVDFSWRVCVAGKLPEKRVNVLGALRRAIADQIAAFRDSAFAGRVVLECPITRAVITKHDCHVDHASPQSFLALANRWLGRYPDPQITESADGYGWQLADAEQKENWQFFHRTNARLRVVSRHANLSYLKVSL